MHHISLSFENKTLSLLRPREFQIHHDGKK
jgi:hypothetical protein